MTGQFSAGGGDLGTWYEPVLESIRTAGLASSGAGTGVIDRGDPSPFTSCVGCDGDDPCLPRWEDDGGGLGPIAGVGLPPGGSPRPTDESSSRGEALG